MRQINSISIIILLAVMTGCVKGNKQITEDLVTVDVTKSYSPQKELVLQDFMDVEYVKLETNDEFITQGSVRAIGQNFMLVTNHNSVRDGNIFVFDRKGKALRKINRRGQGGEEYSNIIEIILDEDRNEMYVHNHYERKIQVYDLFGKFKRTLRYGENTNGKFYTDILNFDKDNLICYDRLNENRAFVLVSKQDGSITKKIEIPFKETKLLVQTTPNGSYAIPDYFRSIIPFKNNWLLLEHSSDTVYSFSPDYELRPFLVRTPSIQSMEPGVFLILRFFSARYYFMETVKNVYNFDRNDGFPKTFFMYDNQEKTFSGYKVYNGDYSTKREIYMNRISPLNQEIVAWQALDAPQLVESYKKGELKGKLKDIAATLDEESNPVIMLIKYKK